MALADAYSDKGRPGAPIRLLVGLLYLKYTFNVSDEDLEPRWVENPYWQYFCGYEFMQHEFPIDFTTLIKWRKRIGVERLRELLKETIDLAVRENSLKEKDLSSVNVDTTVQEKNISFPTDSKLACGLIQKLGVEARSAGVKLRQSYRRLSKKKVVEVARYAHAKQFKRMRKSLSKLETWLKRLIRDIERKASANLPVSLDQLLSLSRRYLAKGKLGQDKLYSICEPSVKCISKGKAPKRYEFGQKISIATTNKNNWVVSVDYLSNNPFDGHSLVDVIQSIEETAQTKVKEVFVDRGYRGNGYKGEAKIHIAGRSNSKLSPSEIKRKKRRSAIEPKIGHLKSDHRMGRCYLKGEIGDEINALLAGAGSKLRKMLGILKRAKVEVAGFVLELKFFLKQLGNHSYQL